VAWLALTAVGCEHASNAKTVAVTQAQPAKVETVKPQRGTVRRTTEQPGQIEAFEETPLLAKISGYVLKLHADIGDRVAAAQVLAELWVPELEAEVKQKQALVQQAKAEQHQADAAVRAAEAAVTTAEAKIAETKAGTLRAEAECARWKSELDRNEELAAKKAIPQKVVDETRSQYRAAEANRDEAAARVASAAANLRESDAKLAKAKADVVAAAARLDVAEANHQQAQIQLQYATIRAPFDGVVTVRNVDTRHLVAGMGPREPLFVVVRADPVRVFVDVPEKDATLAVPGAKAVVRVQALANQQFEGKVTRTAWALESATRTLRTEIDIPNPEGKLRPGMYAYAIVTVEEHADALTLPASAVFRQADQAYCACVVDGKVHRKPVGVGLNDGSAVEIVSGLDGAEAVIRSEAAALAEGQAVAQPPAAGAASSGGTAAGSKEQTAATP
jgi:RND family efflux transporter MFP subunit